MRKLLFIGVGGTGGKTLRYLYRELDRRLAALGWDGPVPECWQFIHIDAPERPDGFDDDVPLVLRSEADGYVPLGRSPHLYPVHDEELTSVDALLPALVGWRPDPASDQEPPWLGAGQRRAIGRVLGLTSLSEVAAAIDVAVGELDNPAHQAEYLRVCSLLDPEAERASAAEKVAVVVSSLGGGTGSGTFLDVVEILLSHAPDDNHWLRSPMTVLFAPDVFDNTPGTAEVSANTLGALSELLAAFEHEGPPPVAEANLLRSQGLGLPPSDRRTAKHNFLIGRESAKVVFKDEKEVYRATAKGLAAMLLVPKAANEMASYVLGNWRGAALDSPLSATGDAQAFSSFGYGNVSLGRTLFTAYASERLAAGTIDRLLHGHRERVPDATRMRDQTVIDRVADAEELGFFRACGLFEAGDDNNQVLDALRFGMEALELDDLEPLRTAESNARVDVATKAMKYLQGQGQGQAKTTGRGRRGQPAERTLSPREWRDTFDTAFAIFAKDYTDRMTAARIANAQAWVPAIQDRLLERTVDAVGQYGLPVTIALLDRLDDQLGSAVADLDKERRDHIEKEENRLLKLASDALTTLSEVAIGANHKALLDSAKARRDALKKRTDASINEAAATLLRDLRASLLPQLRSALLGLQTALVEQLELKDVRAMVKSWATGPVPNHLRPTPNEVLLEHHDTFPATFDRLLGLTFETEYVRTALSSAITEVITGRWTDRDRQGEDRPQTLIDRPARWGAEQQDYRLPDTPVGPAAFEADLDPAMILDRAEGWVRSRDGALANHVAESLAAYLGTGRSADPARAEALVDALTRALGLSAPLTAISPQVARSMHGLRDLKDYVIVTPIPIDAGHRAAPRLRQVLSTVIEEPTRIDALLDANSPAQEIEVMRTLVPSMHPVVFTSLMTPLLESWNRSSLDPRTRRTFWTFRRARPLESHVPLAPSAMEAIVRGWFVATLLNQLTPATVPAPGEPLQVWSPDGLRGFPPYLLGPTPRRFGNVLPALLESFSLSLLACSAGDRSQLAAYERLSELGGHRDAKPEESVAPELVRWITHGQLPKAKSGRPAAPTPIASYAGTAESSMAERLEAVHHSLEDWRSALDEDVLSDAVDRERFFDTDTRWELRGAYREAFSDLLLSIAAIGEPDGDSGQPARPI